MKKSLFLAIFTLLGFYSHAQYSADFENWHNLMSTLTIPNGWNASDSLMKYFGALTNPGATFQAQVEKEMPGNGSATAIKLTTKTHPGLPTILPAGVVPCIASNSKIDVDINTGEFTFTGGQAYTLSPTHATMWVKNNVVNGDSTSISIYLYDNSDGGDSLVAVADTLLGANITNFTQITLPFYYNPTPGFSPMVLRVVIASSGNFIIDGTGAFANLNDGTSIVVDDINVVAPAGVTSLLTNGNHIDVYPTIATDFLHVDFKEAFTEPMVYSIIDMNGSIVLTSLLSEKKNNIDISSLSKGSYIYRLNKDSKPIQSGKFIKE
jgi:hypothetical protein